MLRQCLAALRRRLRTLKTIILRRTPPLPRLAAKEAPLSSKGGRGRHLNERLWFVCVLTKSSSDKEPMSTAAEPCWVNPAQHKGYAGSERSPSHRKKNQNFEEGHSLFKRTFWCLGPTTRLSGKRRGRNEKLAVVMVGTQSSVSAMKGFWHDHNTGVNGTVAKSQHSTFPLPSTRCPNRTSPPQGSSVCCEQSLQRH